MKLLLAEDEQELAEAVADILRFHGYVVDTVYDGEDALAYAGAEEYDGLILDIMMPKKTGLEVLEQLRGEGRRIPVLLLTARSQVEDRILGLDLGADDYLTKPFAMGELLARVRAMLRRREEYTPDVLECGGLSLDRSSFTLSWGGQGMQLPRLEFRMMELLMLNRGRYLSSEAILERVWGYDTETELGTVWVYLSHLRRRLAQLGARAEIRGKRGIGYTLEALP
ncbi:MAG: response regulator transcription factor [Lawsonibacter sp.]|nr:response regulator transcription factor [Lawsonibacter sp.]